MAKFGGKNRISAGCFRRGKTRDKIKTEEEKCESWKMWRGEKIKNWRRRRRKENAGGRFEGAAKRRMQGYAIAMQKQGEAEARMPKWGVSYFRRDCMIKIGRNMTEYIHCRKEHTLKNREGKNGCDNLRHYTGSCRLSAYVLERESDISLFEHSKRYAQQSKEEPLF